MTTTPTPEEIATMVGSAGLFNLNYVPTPEEAAAALAAQEAYKIQLAKDQKNEAKKEKRAKLLVYTGIVVILMVTAFAFLSA